MLSRIPSHARSSAERQSVLTRWLWEGGKSAWGKGCHAAPRTARHGRAPPARAPAAAATAARACGGGRRCCRGGGAGRQRCPGVCREVSCVRQGPAESGRGGVPTRGHASHARAVLPRAGGELPTTKQHQPGLPAAGRLFLLCREGKLQTSSVWAAGVPAAERAGRRLLRRAPSGEITPPPVAVKSPALPPMTMPVHVISVSDEEESRRSSSRDTLLVRGRWCGACGDEQRRSGRERTA
jgi:hypothetical protein